MTEIPWRQLSDEALIGVIDAYVLKEGTDYGHRDHSLESKRRAVRRALEAGSAAIVFDPATGTTDIVERR